MGQDRIKQIDNICQTLKARSDVVLSFLLRLTTEGTDGKIYSTILRSPRPNALYKKISALSNIHSVSVEIISEK